MEKSKKDVANFYDEYTERQLKSGANERLRSLYKRLLSLGLQPKSNVLELGCGVGAFTKLLEGKVKEGQIEAVDLSEKSIKIASQNSKANNVSFFSADIVNYSPQHKIFDFITLFDVLEHIPLGLHQELFANISRACSDGTLITINIPNPEYIDYLTKNRPEKLQIIDQSVHISLLLKNAETAGLELLCFEKYSIWFLEDYHFLTFRKKRTFKEIDLSESRTFIEKVQRKIKRLFRR